jgi:DNA mismatch repair protein MSH5
LEEYVIKYFGEISCIIDVIAELDCLLSFTICAKEYNYTRPTMTKQNILNIVNGRNPLQEICVNTFIPNDTNVDSDSRINIITGPNSSGFHFRFNFLRKSVYLKQIALIVYMAHLGSFCPCDKALIGLTDKIFTRIQSYYIYSFNSKGGIVSVSIKAHLLLI